VWCERQIEVRTAYDIRLTTSALAGLLAAPHPALDAMQVSSTRVCLLGEARVRPSPAQPSLRSRPSSPWVATAFNPLPSVPSCPPSPPPHSTPRCLTPPALQVKGKRLDTDGGIRTRARAAARAEQWSAVPLRVRLIMLLTDAYIEATAQGG
jgi:hypothetical protein